MDQLWSKCGQVNQQLAVEGIDSGSYKNCSSSAERGIVYLDGQRKEEPPVVFSRALSHSESLAELAPLVRRNTLSRMGDMFHNGEDYKSSSPGLTQPSESGSWVWWFFTILELLPKQTTEYKMDIEGQEPPREKEQTLALIVMSCSSMDTYVFFLQKNPHTISFLATLMTKCSSSLHLYPGWAFPQYRKQSECLPHLNVLQMYLRLKGRWSVTHKLGHRPLVLFSWAYAIKTSSICQVESIQDPPYLVRGEGHGSWCRWAAVDQIDQCEAAFKLYSAGWLYRWCHLLSDCWAFHQWCEQRTNWQESHLTSRHANNIYIAWSHTLCFQHIAVVGFNLHIAVLTTYMC